MKRKENTSENELKEVPEKKIKKSVSIKNKLSNGAQQNNNSKLNSNSNNNSKNDNNKSSEHNKWKKTGKKFEKIHIKGKFSKFSSINSKNASNNGEKPNWREFKEEKKKLKLKRKSKKLNDVYEISVKVKKISETYRRKDCDPEKRKVLSVELHELMTGNFRKLIFTRDVSRVIQWLIKLGTPEIRQSIMNELKPSLLEMYQSKYAIDCIKKFLKFGKNSMKKDIVSVCNGHVVKLLSHTVASPIIDMVYKSHASEQAKAWFRQEFYGDMYKNSKDDKVKSLADLIKQAPDMKSATLSAMKININKIVSKNSMSSAIVHSVLSEYLTECSPEDRNEFIATLNGSLMELAQTQDGAKVAMFCIWHGTAKDRKISLKAMKEHIKELATSEHGYLILLSMLDSIDDTVLVKKIFIPEFITHLKEIISNDYGRRVVVYLVARRDTHHFHPKLITLLKEGDNNATSKKPADIRAKELLEAVIDPFLESIANETASWFANSSIAMVTLAILTAGIDSDKLEPAFEAIADFLVNTESKIEDKGKFMAVEHPGIHMVLKKLIVADKVLIEKGRTTFGELLIKKIDDSVVKRWIECNRACFLFVVLMENEKDSVIDLLVPKLKAVVDLLMNKDYLGAFVLLNKLSEL